MNGPLKLHIAPEAILEANNQRAMTPAVPRAECPVGCAAAASSWADKNPSHREPKLTGLDVYESTRQRREMCHASCSYAHGRGLPSIAKYLQEAMGTSWIF